MITTHQKASKALHETSGKQTRPSRSLLRPLVPPVVSFLVNVNYVVDLQLELVLAVGGVRSDASKAFADVLGAGFPSRVQRIRLSVAVNFGTRERTARGRIVSNPDKVTGVCQKVIAEMNLELFFKL